MKYKYEVLTFVLLCLLSFYVLTSIGFAILNFQNSEVEKQDNILIINGTIEDLDCTSSGEYADYIAVIDSKSIVLDDFFVCVEDAYYYLNIGDNISLFKSGRMILNGVENTIFKKEPILFLIFFPVYGFGGLVCFLIVAFLSCSISDFVDSISRKRRRRRCSICGEKMRKNAEFCHICGTKS